MDPRGFDTEFIAGRNGNYGFVERMGKHQKFVAKFLREICTKVIKGIQIDSKLASI